MNDVHVTKAAKGTKGTKLDKVVFLRWITMLEDRVGRALMAPTKAAYYALLSAELTTDEFELAAAQAFKSSRFMPSPQEFLDYARGGTFREQAQTAWDEIRERSVRGDTPLTPPDSDLRATLNKVGGAEAVNRPVDGYALRRAEDGFVERYSHLLWEQSRQAVNGAAPALRKLAESLDNAEALPAPAPAQVLEAAPVRKGRRGA